MIEGCFESTEEQERIDKLWEQAGIKYKQGQLGQVSMFSEEVVLARKKDVFLRAAPFFLRIVI